MLSQMSKCASFGALATVWRSPQPKTSMSRLSRAASMSPVTGVRLTQTDKLGVVVIVQCFGPRLDHEGDLGDRRVGAERPCRRMA